MITHINDDGEPKMEDKKEDKRPKIVRMAESVANTKLSDIPLILVHSSIKGLNKVKQFLENIQREK